MTDSMSSYKGKFVVVETVDDAYLGTLDVIDRSHVMVRTGLVGRPAVVAVDDVVEITLAADHPDVAA